MSQTCKKILGKNRKHGKNMEKYDLMDWETWTISSWCYTYCFANSWANNGQDYNYDPRRDFQIARTRWSSRKASILGFWACQKNCRVDTEKHYEASSSMVFVSRVSSSRVANRHYFTRCTPKNAMMMMMPTEDLICTGCGFLAKIKWMMDGGGKVVSKRNPKAASEMRHNILK